MGKLSGQRYILGSKCVNQQQGIDWLQSAEPVNPMPTFVVFELFASHSCNFRDFQMNHPQRHPTLISVVVKGEPWA